LTSYEVKFREDNYQSKQATTPSPRFARQRCCPLRFTFNGNGTAEPPATR